MLNSAGEPDRRGVGVRAWAHPVVAIAIVGLTLGVAAARATPSAQPRVVRVTAERFQFTPSEITVEPGTEIEFVLSSEDTAHGFHILGQSVDVSIPKRGRGETT